VTDPRPTDPGYREPVPEQRAAIDDRNRDLFLVAGAGTGKTTVLVERFCDAVCASEGPDADVGIENVLAFTFTEKAAAEMKQRIRRELRRRGRPALAREAESAWISTIHAFCRRILGAHPLAAGLDPRFVVLDEVQAGRLAHEAFDAAFERFAAEGDPGRVELAAAYGLPGLREMVITAHDELRSHGEADPELPAIDPPPEEEALRELAAAADALLAASEQDTHPNAIEARATVARALELAASGRVPDEDELAALEVKTKAGSFKGDVAERYRAALRELESRVVAVANAHRYEHLRELVRLYGREYAERKAARSALDFEDLQLRARDLLSRRADLRERLQEQFRHVMVDEFQDTNRLQLEIVELLHGPGTRLFTVGDEFQSIYAFRHADVEVFRELERKSEAAPEEVAGVRRLSGNFRSRPEVIAAVNAIGRALLPDYQELAVGAEPGELRGGDDPAVELLLTEQHGWDEEGALPGVSADEQAQPYRVAEARFLARRLRELADAGFPRGGMVVLLRAFTYVEAYERALEEQGLTPYVVGGRGYWSRQQVTDLRHLLTAIANPLDELALFGALASPACGVRPDTLWLLRAIGGSRRLWTTLRALYVEGEEHELEQPELAEHIPADDAERLRAFCATLLELREEGPRLGLEGLIERAISDTGYDLALLMMDEGRRRMANVRKLMRLAREYEATEGPDLRGFLDFVDGEREIRAREGEASLQAEDHDGVRIMTVHGAKGLEFPLVAVADLGRGLGGGFPPALRLHPAGAETEEEAGAVRVGLRLARLGAKQKPIFDYQALQERADELAREEERRILHVALTRAQERLILSGALKREQLAREERPTAPLIESVLRGLRWQDGDEAIPVPAPSPRPGLDARFEPAEIAVRVNVPGAEAQAALHLPPGPEPADESPLRTPLPDPELRPLAAAAGGPPVRAVSYSALALYERCGYRFYAERVLGLDPDPPRGQEPPGSSADRYAQGRVVHALLEHAARTGWAAPAPELAADLLRREGAPADPAAVERVLGLVEGFLGSPLCASLQGARLAPEAPFAFRLGALIVRGEIDLLADCGEEVVVVDYKSDRLDGAEPAELMERYDVQRRLYALAALRAHRVPVRVAYVFLERAGEPVEQRFEPADAAALQAELEALCARIEANEFPVTDRPGPDLCFDCPARRRLCVYPEERTLGS